MNTHAQKAGLDLEFSETWDYIGLRGKEYIRTGAGLSRWSANALATAKEFLVQGLASWFKHCQDRTYY